MKFCINIIREINCTKETLTFKIVLIYTSKQSIQLNCESSQNRKRSSNNLNTKSKKTKSQN